MEYEAKAVLSQMPFWGHRSSAAQSTSEGAAIKIKAAACEAYHKESQIDKNQQTPCDQQGEATAIATTI